MSLTATGMAGHARASMPASRSRFAAALAALAFLAVAPGVAHAQTSAITGTVKDSSGAVLPGVTVQASSPALIEKTRSAITDASGRYQIVQLKPGTYLVTFTMSGFATVKREGIELTSDFTATLATQMKVGGLEETVTV